LTSEFPADSKAKTATPAASNKTLVRLDISAKFGWARVNQYLTVSLQLLYQSSALVLRD
jgi:hypothetical protein